MNNFTLLPYSTSANFRRGFLSLAIIFLSAFCLTAQTPGASLDFAGDGDRADIGNFQLTSAFTIELWVQPYEKVDFLSIMGNKFGGLENPGFNFTINGFENEDAKLHLETQDMDASTDNAVINWQEWQHIAVTTDGSTATFYVNGVEQASSSNSVSLAESYYETSIGDFTNYIGNGSFNGRMDELRVWNFAKSADQILEQIDCELEGNEAGLTAYYRFNQGEAGADNTSITMLDATVGPDGTLVNFELLQNGFGNFHGTGGVVTGDVCEIVSSTFETEDFLSMGQLTPNPSLTGNTVQITVVTEAVVDDFHINIYNSNGQLLHQQNEQLFAGESTLEIDCTQLPTGIFWIQFEDGENSAYRKLIITK